MRFIPEGSIKCTAGLLQLIGWHITCHDGVFKWKHFPHYIDVIMTTMATQITSLTIVYSTVYSGPDQRKHQSSASLAFVRGIHRGPVNSPHKWPVTRKMFPFEDVIMVAGPLCHRWISLINASDTELWCFICAAPAQMVEQIIETSVIWDIIAPIMTSLEWENMLPELTRHRYGRDIGRVFRTLYFDAFQFCIFDLFSTQ